MESIFASNNPILQRISDSMCLSSEEIRRIGQSLLSQVSIQALSGPNFQQRTSSPFQSYPAFLYSPGTSLPPPRPGLPGIVSPFIHQEQKTSALPVVKSLMTNSATANVLDHASSDSKLIIGKTCTGCNTPVNSNHELWVFDTLYHDYCFACHVCKKFLGPVRCLEVNKKFFCEDHLAEAQVEQIRLSNASNAPKVPVPLTLNSNLQSSESKEAVEQLLRYI